MYAPTKNGYYSGVFLLWFYLCINVIPAVGTYIASVKDKDIRSASEKDWMDEAARPVFAAPSKAVMLETIMKEAEKRKIAPINAKIDHVWKAIPGYNGIEVDIDETLKLAEHQLTPLKSLT